MDVQVHDEGVGEVVLRPVGEIDMATVDVLEKALATALDRPGLRAVVVDLAGVAFLDSSGVRALVDAALRARREGVTLRVVDPRPVVARVLRITAVGELLGLPAEVPVSPAASFRGLN
ncbi:STAS domain-containing protein [Micromonospora globbae]|uniref:STAS domain-containing protein n=1 Tax=Micromonospora globbae TaxID=1894969 RepID=UPI00342AA166|nr:STAS domain-containing protein [Micromonospora globbae]